MIDCLIDPDIIADIRSELRLGPRAGSVCVCATAFVCFWLYFLYFSDFLSRALCMGSQIDEDVLFICLCFVYLHVSPRVVVRCVALSGPPYRSAFQLSRILNDLTSAERLFFFFFFSFYFFSACSLYLRRSQGAVRSEASAVTAAGLNPQRLLVRKSKTSRIPSEHQIRQTAGLTSTRSRRVSGPEVQNAKCSTGMNCHFPSTWTTCPSDDSTQRINSASLTLNNSQQTNLWFGSTT